MLKKVAVIGAGTMGSSIAVCLAEHDWQVALIDVDEKVLSNGVGNIERMFASRLKKGIDSVLAARQMKMIETTLAMDAVAECEFVIEAVSESLSVKKEILSQLERRTNKNCILASNTSGLPITRLAAFTDCPERVIGIHFFNPAHIMNLVEVIPGLRTANEVVERALNFGRSLGKFAVRVEECPSFLVNRLLGRYTNESLFCLEHQKVDVETLDRAACQFAMPIGPLALRDMNGADVGLSVATNNFNEYGERFRPAPLLAAMVEHRLLGRKTGAGFYLYDPATGKRQGANPVVESLVENLQPGTAPKGSFEAEQLFLPMINEAFLTLQEKICAPQDIDPALKAGLNMRRGPFEIAFEIGLPTCLAQIENLFAVYGERFRPAPLLKRFVWASKTSLD